MAELERLGIHFLHLPTHRLAPTHPGRHGNRRQPGCSTRWPTATRCWSTASTASAAASSWWPPCLVNMGYTWQEALRLIQAKRWGAGPHADQIEALVEFARQAAPERKSAATVCSAHAQGDASWPARSLFSIISTPLSRSAKLTLRQDHTRRRSLPQGRAAHCPESRRRSHRGSAGLGADQDDRVVYESADLLYHLFVLLASTTSRPRPSTPSLSGG